MGLSLLLSGKSLGKDFLTLLSGGRSLRGWLLSKVYNIVDKTNFLGLHLG